MTVRDNEECIFDDTCIESNFIVQIESVDGGFDFLASEIVKEWDGSATTRVGDDFLDVLSEGKQIISVAAAGDLPPS